MSEPGSSLSPGLGYESKGEDRNGALSLGVYAVTGEVISTHELGSLARIGSVKGEALSEGVLVSKGESAKLESVSLSRFR